jgi:hypothetical protein
MRRKNAGIINDPRWFHGCPCDACHDDHVYEQEAKYHDDHDFLVELSHHFDESIIN